jgi:hypothetical protein
MPDYTVDGGMGGIRVAPAGVGTLPFPRRELNDEKQTLVHFKIADSSRQHRLEVAQAVTERMRDVRVNGHRIVAICTDEDVTMSAIDMQLLAAHVIPSVKSALGIP